MAPVHKSFLRLQQNQMVWYKSSTGHVNKVLKDILTGVLVAP